MPTTSAAQRSLTTTCSAVVSAIPLITLAMWFRLGDPGEFPMTWALLVLALGFGAYWCCELVGFRTPPLEISARPAADVQAESWRRFTSSTFVRFALCEGVFVVSIALSFVAQSFWVVLLGAVITLPLFYWEVWPGVRNQKRFAASLESRGAASYLLQD